MAAAVLCAAGCGRAAAAQAPTAPAAGPPAGASPISEYRREVFTYQRTGRPDPFQPLLSAAQLGYRVEDLRLTSIIYSPDPRMSVAVIAVGDSAHRFRLRTGQRLGTITVTAIYPRRVDLRVEDFGVPHMESLTLQRPGLGAAAGPTPTGGPGTTTTTPDGRQSVSLPINISPQAPPAQAPAGALRRGGRQPATPATQPTPGGRTANPNP